MGKDLSLMFVDSSYDICERLIKLKLTSKERKLVKRPRHILVNCNDVFYYVSLKVYLLAASKHRLSLQIFICCVYCSPIVPCSQCWRILCSGRTWAFLQVMTSLIGIPNWCWVFRFGGLQ